MDLANWALRTSPKFLIEMKITYLLLVIMVHEIFYPLSLVKSLAVAYLFSPLADVLCLNRFSLSLTSFLSLAQPPRANAVQNIPGFRNLPSHPPQMLLFTLVAMVT